MTVQDLLRNGGECEAVGDLEGAEAAYQEADELHDAEGAIRLGLVLKRRGDMRRAVDAFERAEARGHPEAGSCLGNLLSDNGDANGAKAAYVRSIEAGSTDAVLNLGLMLAHEGEVEGALQYLRVAQDNGDAVASWAIGRLLEGQEDLTGAEAAYRRGADSGDANAAFGLGGVLLKLGDRAGSRAAFQQSHDLGHEGAGQILEALNNEETEAGATAAAETCAKWARLYARACTEVAAATDACLEVANRAIGARNMANKRPQHEISIWNFTKYAEEAEREFLPLYQRFAEANAKARDIAAHLFATHPDPLFAEMILAGSVEDDVLQTVATVRALLLANYGSTPAAFVQGIWEANELMQHEAEGNIYKPPTPTPSDKRTCPWCTETIKAAAVICRFCGKDILLQPNVG
jgi:tetratricopeptide (TPR) repeat protein